MKVKEILKNHRLAACFNFKLIISMISFNVNFLDHISIFYFSIDPHEYSYETVGSVLKIKIVRRQSKRCKLPVGLQGSDKVKSEVCCTVSKQFLKIKIVTIHQYIDKIQSMKLIGRE